MGYSLEVEPTVTGKGNQDDCKVFDPNDGKDGVDVHEIGDSGGDEFCRGGSQVVYTNPRQLLDIQVIPILWEKEGPSSERLQRTQRSLGYSSAEKKKEPSRKPCGVGIIQRMDCALQGVVWNGSES